MEFREAVEAAAHPLNDSYNPGKQALKREHRAQVQGRDRAFTGSVDIDGALQADPRYRHDPRWDYGLGYEHPSGLEQALWIEVHPASTGEVRAVIQKLEWLKQYLNDRAPALNRMTVVMGKQKPFVWLATSSVKIAPNMPQARLLRVHGLDLPRRQITLP